MTISSALSNALSGLTVSARAADVVSSNIANAMTEGYGPRRVDIAARVHGGAGSGARVTGITRTEDPILSAARRQADAALSAKNSEAKFLGELEQAIGTPDQPGSLIAQAAAFEARLIDAANAPSQDAALSAAVLAADALAQKFNAVSDSIQAKRMQADTAIADAVTQLNDGLQSLADLNLRIRKDQGGGRDVSALLDAQAQILDGLSGLIPMTSRRDSLGALELYSTDGQALLDSRPAQLSFDPVAVMTPEMEMGGGLSSLMLNGRPVTTDGPSARLGGGELAALFALRDTWAPKAQGQIDAVALDLASRMDAAAVDGTRGTMPGLFTDAGLVVDPAAERGLAGRLRVNATLHPDHGAEVWRLRDGLGAPAPGPIGDASQLTARLSALSEPITPVSSAFGATARGFAELLATHLSAVSQSRQSVETSQSHAAARQAALLGQEHAMAVDTDDEMQRLLQIEHSYAANARVISAVEEMLDILMGITR